MKVNLSAYAHNLSLLDWQLFGTLTFRTLSPAPRLWSCAWSHFHRLAKLCEMPYGKMEIVLRYELGEHGQRPHFHYLVANCPWRNHLALSKAAEALWRSTTGAIPKVRPYDSALAGSDYVVKCLHDGANEYERRKYDTAEQVEVSDAVYMRMKRVRIAAHAPLGGIPRRTAQSGHAMTWPGPCDAPLATGGNTQVASLSAV